MTASPFRRVVAGYDGSSSGDDALALAVLVAGEPGQLVAARVFSSRRGGAQPPQVAELHRVAEGLGADAEALVARSAAAGLHDLAAEIDADLLVVGSAERATRPIAVHDRYEAASRIAQERAPGSVRAATTVVRGTPAAVLRDEAEKGIDLLAIGSRGFGPVRRTFSGSVASALTHDLPCPLLVFPRGAEEPGPMERVEIDPAERR